MVKGYGRWACTNVRAGTLSDSIATSEMSDRRRTAACSVARNNGTSIGTGWLAVLAAHAFAYCRS
jgi:hypothetical protein